MGDFTQREDDRMVEDRDPIGVDKDNFNDVLKAQNLSLKINVDDKLSDEDGNKLCVDIAFDGMSDFSPDRIVQQVPELKKLLQLRDSLKALKVRFPIFPSFASKFRLEFKIRISATNCLKSWELATVNDRPDFLTLLTFLMLSDRRLDAELARE